MNFQGQYVVIVFNERGLSLLYFANSFSRAILNKARADPFP